MPVFQIEANGKTFEVEAPDQQAALGALQGFGQSDPYKSAAVEDLDKLQEAGIPADQGYGRQVLQGATLGLADEVYAGLQTPIEMLKRGTWSPAEGYNYAKAREDETLRRSRADTGNLGTAAEVAGGLATGGALSGAGLTLIPKAGAGVGRMIGGAAAEGALYGGISGAAEGEGLQNRLEQGAMGALTGGAVGGVLGGLGAAVSKPSVQAPSIDQVRAAKNAAYQSVDDMGVKYTPEAVADLNTNMQADLRSADIDDLLNPRASRVASLLDKRLSGGGQTLSELDRSRQFINNNVVDVPGQKIEGRFAGIMRDRLDDFIDNAQPGQVATGDPQAAAQAIREARSLNTRVRKYDQVAEALQRAERRADTGGTGGNIDNTSRQNIRAILDNPKKSKGFSEEERAMMEAIVKGSRTQNIGRQLGKLSPSGNGLQQSLAIGATALNPAMAALPGVGIVSKVLSDRTTARNADNLLASILAGQKVDGNKTISPSLRRAISVALASSDLQE